MRARYRLWILAGCAAAFGCGGSAPERETPAGGATPAAATDLISADALAGCAGFSAARAASLLGVPPEVVTDFSRTEGRLRMCHYRNADDVTKSVSFTLGHRESVEQAKSSMQRERESMGAAQGAIDRVTGSQSKTAASEDMSGIGDEAFYSAMNGAIMLRVGNVLAQVTSPGDLALKKRAAEAVAQALRQQR